ncbi:MAG: FtsW/RodA/SpoVE family cell cycle protein, partial [Clostridiales bacterium]|nr:FtsW/RodA/SpoVE family cell cycle protein [Clostridiales bacterium]
MEITMLKQYKPKNFKFILVMYVVLLNTLGVLLVGSASPGDQNKQLLGMLSGLALMLVIAFIDYNFILRFAWLLYLLSILMLILVRFAGDGSKGAQRWFEIGSFRFQPSELVKILMILFFAYYFMKHEEKINRGRTIFSSLVLIGIPLALIVMQPNLSMTIIIALVFAAML